MFEKDGLPLPLEATSASGTAWINEAMQNTLSLWHWKFSLNVDMVVVWAVVDVFVGQLSVPPQVAQTVGPQKHQQRPTKTAAHSMLTW